MNPVAPKRPTGAPKRPVAFSCFQKAPKRPRVRTSNHRTCCPNLSRHRLPKAEPALEKPSVTYFYFIILPDEFIDDQIDNLATTKNCHKGPCAARDPIHPWSGVETCTWGGPAWPWSWPLNMIYLFHFDLKIQSDKQNLQKQKARSSAKAKLFWGKFLPQFEDKQWTAFVATCARTLSLRYKADTFSVILKKPTTNHLAVPR